MKKRVLLFSLGVLVLCSYTAFKSIESEQGKFNKEILERRRATKKQLTNHLLNHSTPTSNEARYLPGKVIVKLKSFTPVRLTKASRQVFSSIPSLNAKIKGNRVSHIQKIFPLETSPDNPEKTDLSRIYELNFDPALEPWQVAKTFENDEYVEYAEPHFIYELAEIPDDSLYETLYHLPLIEADRAWDITHGSEDIIIGIVDSGIDWGHPDLVDNIWQNLGEDADGDGRTIELNGSQWVLDPGDLNGIDDDDFDGDPATFIDDLIGWDVANNDNNTMQSNNHGTHVAGMASAATNNRIGVAGVGYNCKIMPVKVASDGQNFVDFGFTGIKYAVDSGADIINLSWGGSGISSFGLDVIQYAHEQGIVLVAAAGNSNSETQDFPAAYPHVLSVAATGDYYDIKASFSNFGYWIDLSAPGLWVMSTDKNASYQQRNGTSFASPIVAGVAALVKSIHPDWSADQISEQVRVSADDIESSQSGLHRGKLGFGRVNAYQALTRTSPAIRIAEVQVSDRLGNSNNIIEHGESIELIVSVTNFLENADQVTLSLQTDSPYISIANNTKDIGALGSGQTFSTADNPFQFAVADTTPYGSTIEFVLNIEANNRAYKDREPIYLNVAPLHRDHDIGNVRLTLTSFGAMGYFEYVESALNIGKGFEFPKGAASTLFHGSFMVGASASQVSDVAYGDKGHSKYDWVPDNDVYLSIQKDSVAEQEGFARYNDSNADNPIGVMVSQRSFAYANPPYDDFVIIEFKVENTNSTPIDGLYTALFMDWDIQQSGNDQVGYESDLGLGYMYDAQSNYYGLALLGPSLPASHRAIKNAEYIWNGFADETKFEFMKEGFQLAESDALSDWSHILSSGPHDLQPGESATVTYAILGGTDRNNLRNNTQFAKEIYLAKNIATQISGSVGYYSDNRSVEGCELTLNDIHKDFTDANGNFGFSNPPVGTNRVSIKKNSDLRNAISGTDALLTLQFLASLKSFDDRQLKATDVTLDGKVDAGDAAAIQGYLAFLPAKMSHTGQWVFSPADTSFDLTEKASLELDISAYLLGDCTGDWGSSSNSIPHTYKGHPGQTLDKRTSSTDITKTRAKLRLPELEVGAPGSTISVPIYATTDSTIGFAQIVVEFNDNVFKFTGVQVGSDAAHFSISQVNTDLPFSPSGANVNENILVQLSGDGANTISGVDQEIAILNFEIVKSSGSQKPFIFEKQGDRTFLITGNLFAIIENDIEFIEGFGIISPVEEQIEVPQEYALYQNFPNPFNPETKISYQLPEVATVILQVYNLSGQEIKAFRNDQQEAGNYSVVWDGKDYQGKVVPSGIYFYRVFAKSRGGKNVFVQTRKMSVVR